MSERVARVGLGVVSGLVLLLSLLVELPAASEGRFWSDGATYHAMAGSLAFDRDLEFSAVDLARVKAVYPGGPQGVFLKRVRDASGASRLVYAKAAIYPALAAPLVRLSGVDRGLLLLNALAFLLALWLGYAELRRRDQPLSAAAGALAVVGLGVAPVYLLWETPELLNLALATAGLVAWRRERPLVAAIVLGLAAYSKPTQLALALPLLLAPLLVGAGSLAARVGETARRAVVLAAVVAACFGAGWLLTGEANYQGGERKTFYDRYPFEPGVSFDSAGVWMTTEHLGPLVAGRDAGAPLERVAPPRSSAELRRSFLLNLGYFWVGRFGGALPYFPGFVAAALLFPLAGPRPRAGWLALVAVAAAWIGTILLIPDNWYGGSGTIGNRYLLGFVPLGLLLLPPRRGLVACAGAALVSAALLPGVLLSPVHHSLRPGEHATQPAFRLLPAELTMLSDLSVFTDVWRKRRPYPGYFLWFLDDGSFGQETSFGEEGFWVGGGAGAQVVLQALEPAPRVRLRVTAGPAGDVFTARIGSDRQRLVLAPLKSGEIVFAAPPPELGYYGTSLYLLKLGSRLGGATEQDQRKLGSFVRLELEGTGQQPAFTGGIGGAQPPQDKESQKQP